MKSLFAVAFGLGLVAASAASAACPSGHVSADAGTTPIVTADTAAPSTPVVTDNKG